MSPPTPALPALAELAGRYGVQVSFVGTDGRVHRAEDAVIVAILAALGAPIASGSDVADALAERRRVEASTPLEPVLVHRVGRAASAEVTLPGRVHPRDVWCSLALEDGRVHRQRLTASISRMQAMGQVGVEPANRYRFRLDQGGTEPIAPGYHRVVVEWPGAQASALLIAAPRCPAADRGWGLFLPLHAVRTEQDWGVGSYTDMAELGHWVKEMGASMLGALPLYPAFLDPPADPSPYLPVSRLAYNEVFVDPTVLPELAAAPEARRLLGDDEFRRQVSSAHGSTLVDYETVAHLRRQVLAPMAEALLAAGSVRRDAFCAWVDAHPELLAYARFRAAGDRLGHRPGTVVLPRPEGPDSEPSLGYHLYAQWVAAQQLSAAGAAVPLYADLPIGVHPDGFDPLWAPAAFVRGAHGGAPPDLFFAGGQDWAFPPLHPERMRDDGYDYFIGVLRRAFRHAASLRVDHIMGLQRLYWIPEGFDARHGAYVSYRADELHAVRRPGGAPGRRGRGGRGPGYRARRGADAVWPKTACCAPGFCSSNRPRWTRCRPFPLAYWPRGAPMICPVSSPTSMGTTSTNRSAKEAWRPPTPLRRASPGRTGAPRCSGPSVSTRDSTTAAWPLGPSGGACSIWPRVRRISSWSTWRICGGSTSRRTARAPGPVPPTGGAAGSARWPRRGATAGPRGSCARLTAVRDDTAAPAPSAPSAPSPRVEALR